MLRSVPTLAVVALLVAATTASAQLPAGGFASPDVAFVKNVATGPSSGGKRVGDHFYLTTGRDLRIFDIKTPENPTQVGLLMLTNPGPGEQRAPEEDPDTNGKILLTTNGGAMQVYDVSDKAAPKFLSELAGVEQHTISCVLDCTYAYGSEGVVIDLRDPKAPKEAGDWAEAAEVSGSHDVTEVAPGFVFSASQPMLLMDVRKDPAKPVVLASIEAPGFVHQTLWPRIATDPLFLSAGEATGPACEESASATFDAWSAPSGLASKAFTRLATWKMSSGVGPAGANASTTFCTHWFTEHPNFANGGVVAMGWYEYGTRFLKVAPGGAKIEEVGWFLPSGTRSSAAYWITDRIVYIADYYRGLDVVKWNGEIPPPLPPGGGAPGAGTPSTPATPPRSGPPSASGPSLDDFVTLPSAKRCANPRSFRVKVRRYARDPVASLDVRVNGKRRVKAKGRALRKPVKVKRLPRGRFSLQVIVRTRSGHTTAGSRSYRRCAR